jgi:hypothetical protein
MGGLLFEFLAPYATKNNWGQININFQFKGAEADGGFLMVGYHKSSVPVSLCPFKLEINVDLTPIIFLGGNFLPLFVGTVYA